MTDFFAPGLAINDESFIRGAGRMLWAVATQTFPTKIGDVVNMSTYSAMAGWNDLGATKTGIAISVNNTEEGFDVDQVFGEIDSLPTNWTMEIATSLAEMTVDRLAVAWEGDTVTTTSEDGYSVKVGGFGTPFTYTKRRLAVLFPRPSTGKIRAYIFRKVQRTTQDSTVNHNKVGEQISIPIRFRCLPDLSIATAAQRFMQIRDQL